MFYYCFAVILFSPTLAYAALVYTPIYVTFHLIQMYIRYDMKKSKVFGANIQLIIFTVFFALVTFYII